MYKKLISAVVAAAAMSLIGCGSESVDDSASFSLAITDAPVDSAAAVYVQFTGVELKPSDGTSIDFDFDSPRTINLLALQDGDSQQLLTNEQIDAGAYNWMRLKVNAVDGVMDSYIEFEDGTQYPLYVPSGANTGLKLVRGFNVAAGQAADFTIDFDLRKSVTKPGATDSSYILKPALRVIDNTEIGEVVGSVEASTMEAGDCGQNGAAVYVFEGSDVVADDMGSATAPISSANVKYNAEQGTYDYTAAFLAPGDYTVALTCQAINDDPETDDDIMFEASNNATVVADESTTSNF